MKISTVPFVLSAASVLIAGCQDPAPPLPDTETSTEHSHGETAHTHPTHGPHGGDLVELGNEEYHGEVVHNEETGTVEIYILDSSATQPVAIEASELTINMTHGGQPEQFTLTAHPNDNEQTGKSSRFVSDDSHLSSHLDDHDMNATLVAQIKGRSYRGKITHRHTEGTHHHDDHDHQHD